jgi:hypothetical protein
MKTLKLAIATLFALLVAGAASAADWTTEDGGSQSCTKIQLDGVCWLSGITEDSSAIFLRGCATFTIQVYGTGADIMPQTCTDKNCGTTEDLLATSLTGDSPNAAAFSKYPYDFIRIDWTAGGAAPTVSIKCGR